MKKKLLALFLTVVTLIGLAPAAFASEDYSGGASSGSVDHIDIGQKLSVQIGYNGKTYTIPFTLTTADADSVVITNDSGVSFSRTGVSTSTDNAGNRQIRIKGSFPVGTMENPVRYTVSLTKDFTIIADDGAEITVPVTLSVTMGYWDLNNVCPGLGKNWQNGVVSDRSGIDLELTQSSDAHFGVLFIQKNVEGIQLKEAQTFSFEVAGNGCTQTVNITVQAGGTTGVAMVAPLSEGEYTVTEKESEVPDGYTLETSYSSQLVTVSAGNNASVIVTNCYQSETITISGSKTWNDGNNQDGKRPDNITVNLMANGDKVDSKTVTAADDWSWSFTAPKYASGQEIVYTIEEETVEDYQTEVKGYNITNTHQPETITISGSKTWNDGDNQDGKRPDSITVNLMANGEKVDSKTVTAADDWSWSFTAPKYASGQEIVYSIVEEAVEEYSTTYNGYDVINEHTPGQISITVTKAWDDQDNQDGIRPEEVTIELLANGQETGKTLVLNENNQWSSSFAGLDQYHEGKEIQYTVKEKAAQGYTAVITGDMIKGYIVTNVHEPETMDLRGTKTWDDQDNQDGKRPASITVTLMANGDKVESQVVTAETNWVYTFESVDRFANGKEIVYSIVEDAIEGYSAVYDGLNVTNHYTPEKTSISVVKAWKDQDNQDGIRPDSIIIKLLANGKDTGKTLKLDKQNGWTGSFTGLDLRKDGKRIQYSIEEVNVAGYSSQITGDAVSGFVVTNSHSVVPKTGDESQGSLFGTMAAVCAVMLSGTLVYRKKKKSA